MDMAHEKRQETSKSAFDAPCSIFERKCPRCQPGLEQNDAGQSQNICSAPNHGIITSAGLSSQTSAAFCVPEGVAHSYNVCITEEGAEGEVRVGWKGYATRWKKGSVLRYIVCAETFPSLELAELTAREAAKAALMWQNIGVRFKKVGRDEKATFAIKYRIVPHDCRPDVYASAFFPGTSPGELFVYQLALKPSDVRFLANILAHEFGHILGLRHEFAVKPSFLWGEANDRSVMNYFSDLIQLQVGEQDRKDLATYYECEAGQYERLSITDIEPRVFRFPCVNKKYDINRYRSTRKRLYLKQFTQILLSLAFIRFCYDFAIFVSLACRAFFLG
ncbi:uncharacterized protein TrAFT101_005261 [Trichoderma asperellum]|uniref:uncharacterized protein n=1 Tax=Trichoderma asperellum TaxID=101201 RepID=UPI003332A223|nr:hypothetical protein TrAFT101_005261 [Trichoderma asperellum]